MGWASIFYLGKAINGIVIPDADKEIFSIANGRAFIYKTRKLARGVCFNKVVKVHITEV
jgi:hypothetical protein